MCVELAFDIWPLLRCGLVLFKLDLGTVAARENVQALAVALFLSPPGLAAIKCEVNPKRCNIYTTQFRVVDWATQHCKLHGGYNRSHSLTRLTAFKSGPYAAAMIEFQFNLIKTKINQLNKVHAFRDQTTCLSSSSQ